MADRGAPAAAPPARDDPVAAARALAIARAIDEIRADMIASLPARMSEIDAALAPSAEAEGAERARRLLHRLRGSAGSVGLLEVAERAARMEAVLDGREAGIDGALAGLRAAVGRALGA